MKAISLWQPWASAVALGLKRIETRHWSTDYRGPVAIHAAKRWTREEREFAELDSNLPEKLPLGAIVCTAMLIAVRPTHILHAEHLVTPLEARYGNFDPHRFGWMLENVLALPDPIPFKGKQAFFNVPDHLIPTSCLQVTVRAPHQQPELFIGSPQ